MAQYFHEPQADELKNTVPGGGRPVKHSPTIRMKKSSVEPPELNNALFRGQKCKESLVMCFDV